MSNRYPEKKSDFPRADEVADLSVLGNQRFPLKRDDKESLNRFPPSRQKMNQFFIDNQYQKLSLNGRMRARPSRQDPLASNNLSVPLKPYELSLTFNNKLLDNTRLFFEKSHLYQLMRLKNAQRRRAIVAYYNRSYGAYNDPIQGLQRPLRGFNRSRDIVPWNNPTRMGLPVRLANDRRMMPFSNAIIGSSSPFNRRARLVRLANNRYIAPSRNRSSPFTLSTLGHRSAYGRTYRRNVGYQRPSFVSSRLGARIPYDKLFFGNRYLPYYRRFALNYPFYK